MRHNVFAAQIVHNLNNPLMATFGALDLSKMAWEQIPPDLDLLTRTHESLSKSADNLKSIIRTILLHARDRSIGQKEAVGIHRLINYEMEFFSHKSPCLPNRHLAPYPGYDILKDHRMVWPYPISPWPWN